MKIYGWNIGITLQIITLALQSGQIHAAATLCL
jgi:hypothetical protein